MQNAGPRNSRGKRLHIVYFTDASRTKSTSVSLRLLAFGTLVSLGVLGAAGTCIYLYSQTRVDLARHRSYVKELKAALIAETLASQPSEEGVHMAEPPARHAGNAELAQQILANAEVTAARSEASGKKLDRALTTSLDSNVLKEASETPSDFSKSNSGVRTLPNKEIFPARTAADVALAAKRDKAAVALAAKGLGTDTNPPSAQPGSRQVPPDAFATLPGGARNAGVSGNAVNTGNPGPGGVDFSAASLKFAHVSLAASEDEESTVLSFELINQDQANVRAISGRVCAVAEIDPGQLPEGSAHAGKTAVTAPGNARLDSQNKAIGPCLGGQLVRFARLRPTSIVLPVPQEAVKKAVLYFTDIDSGKRVAHPVEDVN